MRWIIYLTVFSDIHTSVSVHTHGAFGFVGGLNFPRLWADSAACLLYFLILTPKNIFRYVMNAEGAASSWDETGLLLGRGGGSLSSDLPVSPTKWTLFGSPL